MNDTENTVRQFHESRDMRDPERGVAVIAPACKFEDVARNEARSALPAIAMTMNAGARPFLMVRSRSSMSS